MNRVMLWHYLRFHRVHNTGACDMWGTQFRYCVTCQDRGVSAAWRGSIWSDQ